jgi:hypothetical protein
VPIRLPLTTLCRQCWQVEDQRHEAEKAAQAVAEEAERRRWEAEMVSRRPIGRCWTCGREARLMGAGRYCSLDCWERGGKIRLALR